MPYLLETEGSAQPRLVLLPGIESLLLGRQMSLLKARESQSDQVYLIRGEHDHDSILWGSMKWTP